MITLRHEEQEELNRRLIGDHSALKRAEIRADFYAEVIEEYQWIVRVQKDEIIAMNEQIAQLEFQLNER